MGDECLVSAIHQIALITAEKQAEKLENTQVRACSKNVSIQTLKFKISKIFKISQKCEGGWVV